LQLLAAGKFIEDRGAWKWNEIWDTIVRLDPDIVEAYATYSSIPDKRGYLNIRVRKFIYIAIDSITGSQNVSGLKGHMKHALQLGITLREILAVLEITSMLGSTSYSLGIPLLMDKLRQRGIDVDSRRLTCEQEKLKEDYIRDNNGYWSQNLENILKMDTDYFSSFTAFEDVPRKTGTLSPKERELVYIAVHAAPVSLNMDALKLHISMPLTAVQQRRKSWKFSIW